MDVWVDIEKDKVVAVANGEKSQLRGNFEVAQNPDKMNDAVYKTFDKTGDLEFDLGNLSINNLHGFFVPVSMLNELRRDLYAKVKLVASETVIEKPQARNKPNKPKWIVQIDSLDKCARLDLRKIDEIIYLLDEETALEDIKSLPKDKIRIALPIICRNVTKFQSLINQLLDAGYKKWEINNYWGFSVLPTKNIDLSLGNMLYMFNTQAVAMAKDMGATRITLGLEDTQDNLQKLSDISPLPVVFTVYQNPALFVSAVCVRDNSCAECDKKVCWGNLEKDGKQYLLKSVNCQTEVYSAKAFSAADELSNLSCDYAKADFCHINYTADEVSTIWQKLYSKENPLGTAKANIRRTIF